MSRPPVHRLLERGAVFIDRIICGRGGGSRFGDRSVRLVRQEESRVFDRFLMPFGRVIAVAGAAGIVIFGLEAVVSAEGWPRGLRASIGALMVPVVLVAVRLLRGHYSRDLREP